MFDRFIGIGIIFQNLPTSVVLVIFTINFATKRLQTYKNHSIIWRYNDTINRLTNDRYKIKK